MSFQDKVQAVLSLMSSGVPLALKVEREFHGRGIQLLEESHAQAICIEWQGLLGVLDT